jgi:O-antigen ligase/polysaccharide polymerase Wzy-like membrane protein
MKSNSNPAESGSNEIYQRVIAGMCGAFFGLSLLKFGNPVVMDKFVEWPENPYAWVLNPWPVVISYWLLAVVVATGIFASRWKTSAPRWLLLLPLVWLAWQFVAGTQTVNISLTRITLKHFAGCVICFYLGLFVLARMKRPFLFWLGLFCAFVAILAAGIEQHFGGLADARRYFFAYLYSQPETIPPELLKKFSSDRIFSTLFYPNTLAGALLLLLPPTLAVICRMRLTIPAKWFLSLLVGLAALACLYWSGSKGGWLLMLLLGLAALFRLPFGGRQKLLIAGVILIFGLAGFFLKHAAFFQRGATSVSARVDYWQAALEITAAHPVFGTGPGTFSIAYQKVKKPEWEMARLTHNDYLQQASDSGVVGFATYSLFIFGALGWIFSQGKLKEDWLRFCVWLGLLGLALQGFFEFGLYVPALAWTAFALTGWLLGSAGNQIDNPAVTRYSSGK